MACARRWALATGHRRLRRRLRELSKPRRMPASDDVRGGEERGCVDDPACVQRPHQSFAAEVPGRALCRARWIGRRARLRLLRVTHEGARDGAAGCGLDGVDQGT